MCSGFCLYFWPSIERDDVAGSLIYAIVVCADVRTEFDIGERWDGGIEIERADTHEHRADARGLCQQFSRSL